MESMEADVSDGFVEELDYPFNRFGLPVPSSPTKPWKTLRVSNSSHSLGPLSISRRKKFDLLSLSVRYLAPATRVAGFEVFFSGRFWVFPDILSPVAGARFGYELMWLVLFSHVFKYPAFEFGPRFAVATGTSLIRGYQDVPGPKNWAVWAFLVTTVLQGLVLLAGMLSVTAAILVASFGMFSLTVWVVILGVAIVVLHRMGRYTALAVGSKIAMFVLTVVSVIAFCAAPPRWSDLTQAFIPSIPTGSLVLVAAILGLMPTGINVAIWHSLWALEQMDDLRQAVSDKREMLRLGLLDLKVGYILSAVLALIFVSLGANLLGPRGLTPSGIDVALTLSRIYTEVLGDWMFPVFMLAAFAAMFSTAYSVMDGFPRTFSTLLRTLYPANETLKRASDPAYWIFMAVIFAFAIGANYIFPILYG